MESRDDQSEYESFDGRSPFESDETEIPGIDVIEVLKKIASISGSRVVVLEDGAKATQVFPVVE
jgi:hypothetical protein